MSGPTSRWRRRDDDVGSFRRQLVISTAVLGTLIALALVGVVEFVINSSSNDAVSRVLQDRADAVVSSADVASTVDRLVVPDAQLDPGVAIYDDRGRLAGGDVPPSQARFFDDLATSTTVTNQRLGDAYELLAQPFTTVQGSSGVVVVAEPLAPYENDEHTALTVSLVAGGLIVLVATALAAWASRRALAPVAAMAATAEDWSEHDLDRRFDLGPPTNEIRALGHTLDGLLSRVAGAILAEQRLTSELAHELRSPLTAVKGTADLMAMRPGLDDDLREDVADIQAACVAMAATITGLVDLARSQSTQGSRPAGATVELESALAGVLADLGEPAGVELRPDPALRLSMPLDLAVRAISPVVHNAVRLSSRVVVVAALDGDQVRIQVSDDGPGLGPSHGLDVFEPGHTTGDGSGLGLPLARRIARSVGGDVTVDTRHPGLGGATFVVSLPGRSATP